MKEFLWSRKWSPIDFCNANKLRRTSTLTSLDPRSTTRAATLFVFGRRGDPHALPPIANDWAHTGPTGREPRAPVDSPRDRFFPCGLGDHAMSRTVHLEDALRRRLPVALAAWVERPSEGRALLGWLRELPSSAPLVHPLVIDAPSARSGVSSRPSRNRSRPSMGSPSAKRSFHAEDQGAFHHQRSARGRRSLCASVSDRSSLTPLPRKEHCEPPPRPFPVQETSLGF